MQPAVSIAAPDLLQFLNCLRLQVSSPDFSRSFLLANKSCEKYPTERSAKKIATPARDQF